MDRNLRKERIGVVSSNKMEKTIVVSETTRVKHPMYGKFVENEKIYCTRRKQRMHRGRYSSDPGNKTDEQEQEMEISKNH
jgi:ribosomal protein S17